MKRLVLTLAFALMMMSSLPTASLKAQLYPPNEVGVSMGAWHTIVKDVDVTRKWWELWGGKPMTIDGVDVMKFPASLSSCTRVSRTARASTISSITSRSSCLGIAGLIF